MTQKIKHIVVVFILFLAQLFVQNVAHADALRIVNTGSALSAIATVQPHTQTTIAVYDASYRYLGEYGAQAQANGVATITFTTSAPRGFVELYVNGRYITDTTYTNSAIGDTAGGNDGGNENTGTTDSTGNTDNTGGDTNGGSVDGFVFRCLCRCQMLLLGTMQK